MTVTSPPLVVPNPRRRAGGERDDGSAPAAPRVSARWGWPGGLRSGRWRKAGKKGEREAGGGGGAVSAELFIASESELRVKS